MHVWSLTLNFEFIHIKSYNVYIYIIYIIYIYISPNFQTICLRIHQAFSHHLLAIRNPRTSKHVAMLRAEFSSGTLQRKELDAARKDVT